MNDRCKLTIDRVKELIDKEKNELESYKQPEIHQLDGALLLQFFKYWTADVNFSNSEDDNEFEYLHKPIEILNNQNNLHNVKFCYNALESIVKYVIPEDEMLIMLDGCAEIREYDTDKNTIINPFNVYTLKKGQVVDFKTTCEFNYYVLVQLKSPLS